MDHGGCALLVGVKNNRIVKIKGDPDGFLNKGYICPKATRLTRTPQSPCASYITLKTRWQPWSGPMGRNIVGKRHPGDC